MSIHHIHRFPAAAVLAVMVLATGCANGQTGRQVVEARPLTVPSRQFAPLPKPAPPQPATSPQADPDQLAAQIDALLQAFDAGSEFSHVTELAADSYQGRETGSAGARAAAAYISDRFAELGLKPWSEIGLSSYAQPFAMEGYADENVIGVMPGSPGGGYVILAAHYDHLGSEGPGLVYNGADDNAAGVAAVIEAARVIQASGLRPSRSIVFCAFSGEEQGQYGAQALGQVITETGLAGEVQMINVDGIGATGGSYLGVWDQGASFAAPLVTALKGAGSHLGIAVREEGTDIGSDAQPFDWQFGIPAVTVDWHWGQDESAFHPYYHTIYDDPENISLEAMAQATRTIIAGTWLAAASPA